MNPKTKLFLGLALLLTLALPLLVPSGALLQEHRDAMQEEIWALQEEEEQREEALDLDAGSFWQFLLPGAHAEEKQDEEVLAITPLPMDFSPGHPLSPEGFRQDGYVDDSISLKLETRTENGVMYRLAFVDIKDPSQLRTATAGKLGGNRVAMISSMAEKNNAVIAINANYMSNDPVKTSFEYRMGTKARNKPNRTKDLLIIDENADFHLFIKSDKNEIAAFQKEHEIINAFTFGPALVKDGLVPELDKNYGYNPHGDEPRMAIGQLGPLSYVLVMAEGRSSNSSGVTHQELAEYMLGLGCLQAFNLDGGNSATMVFNGIYYNNKTRNNERAQSDMIYFASGIGE